MSNSSETEIQRYYGPENSAMSDQSAPGEFPFTRGIQKTMYRERLWTMRQYAGFGSAQQTNARFRWLLSQGQTGLSTAFDLPTQMGLDADDPRARGEVGRVGVHIGNIDDMLELFAGIPLDQVSTSLTINATASVLLAFYVAVAKIRQISPAALKGTLQNDILKEFIARGTQIFPVQHSLRLCIDTMDWSLRHSPQFHPISISGYHIREAGSTAVQEIAFTLANAKVYVEHLLSRGVDIDVIGSRLAFFFGCHNNFLEEIAKFRAARRVWARIMRDQYQAKEPRSQAMRFHVQTCGSTLTSQQPMNNAMRVAWQAMSAVLGGAQSLHTNSYDEALALPSTEAAQLALRTQQILAFETGITDTVDPVGGAWAIEALTDSLDQRIYVAMEQIEKNGGMLKLIKEEVIQKEIQDSAFQYQQEIELGLRKIVGVNTLQLEESKFKPKLLKVSPRSESDQIKRLKIYRKKRDVKKTNVALQQLSNASGHDQENLFPYILNAVEAKATIGEICDILRKNFGEQNGR